MFRTHLLAVLSVALALLLSSQVLADGVEKGKVATVGDNKISILENSGDQKEFVIADNAKIIVDGKPAKLSDIDVGDIAKITTKTVQGKEVAVLVEVMSNE